MRVAVNGSGRLVGVAYTDTVLEDGQRVVDVTQREYSRLLAGETAWLVNRETLQQIARARNALDGNRDFLALSAPTNAQAVQQVQRLTRQVNAMIKLVLADLHPELLDDIDDT